MLIKCPECNKEVSDQAESCPHCGYVLFHDEMNTFNHSEEVDTNNKQSDIKGFKKFLVFIGITVFIIAIVFGIILSIQHDKISKYQHFESTLVVLEYLDNNKTKTDSLEYKKMIKVIDQDIVHICYETEPHFDEQKTLNHYYYAIYENDVYIYYVYKKDGDLHCVYLGKTDDGYCQHEGLSTEFFAAKLAYRAYENNDNSYPIAYYEIIDKKIYDSLIVNLLYK